MGWWAFRFILLPKVKVQELLELHLIKGDYFPPSLTTFKISRYHEFINSNILELHHLTKFANWIDRKVDSFYKNFSIPYKFKFLFTSKKSMESNLSYREYDSILIVAQIKNSEQLNKYVSKTAEVSYVSQKEYAIFYNEEEPGFGRGPDLVQK
ncbi:6681_t:CDS:2 [Funneliformis geosporum]|uniref:8521_t:CDS:1 n=1 Tax=Funneliformis geosporum TaxID=1117311 RepID=A0A9W4SA86_9GLOM|nr:6681_t:CDS:2 [Funneliformis geosporum]CAI2162459.1 8521_t:CDS:2 [Funneliformis geosporum]